MDEIQSQIPETDSSDDDQDVIEPPTQEVPDKTEALTQPCGDTTSNSDGEPDEFQATQNLLEEDNHDECIIKFREEMEKHNIDIDALKQYIEWLQTRDSNQIERIQTALTESGLSLTQVKAYVWFVEKKKKAKL